MDDWKKLAADTALSFVEPGMKLGLGTGSTAAFFVTGLAARVREGLDVVCVPTSQETERQAEREGLRLTTLDETPMLDMAVDGADEIDSELRLIKGGGGALLREKIVATAADRLIIIADQSKLVQTLGAFPLPVEVVPFGLESTRQIMSILAQEADCEGEIKLRTDAQGAAFVTDNGNYILDCAFEEIPEPEILSDALQAVPGVVEHGLFIGIADAAVIGGADGVKILEAPDEIDEDD